MKQPTWRALLPGIVACVCGAAITVLALLLPVRHDDVPAPAGSLAIDPVCGMNVVVDDTTVHVDHHGGRFFFCAASCRDKFLAAPERYPPR